MNERLREEEVTEIRLAADSIEAIARRICELIAVPVGPRQQITAGELAELWGVERRWVYDHATELGARRLGSGRRPRLRFDPEEVAERLGAAPRATGGPSRRRVSSIAGDSDRDSLSARSRANFGRQRRSSSTRRWRGLRSGPGKDRGSR